ncbi:hypothetical protein HMPREF1579_00952 [Gardnerella vaginalis JCP8066]|nr:hypothetical protein HMPREF1579_00952 [Gardnerella vaginalis JCP8066]
MRKYAAYAQSLYASFTLRISTEKWLIISVLLVIYWCFISFFIASLLLLY